jgi:hypothetical protein
MIGLIAAAAFAASAWAQNNPAGPPADSPGRLMTDIHDIKDPWTFPAPPYWLAWILAALVAAALAWWLIRRWKNRTKPPQPAAPPLPPDRAAVEALDRLAGRNLAPKAHYFELSLILRTYIEGRYGIGAVEMTTEEFLPRLRDLGLGPTLEAETRRFALETDPIKYADTGADRPRMVRDLEWVRGFVDRTRPKETDVSV